jgi:fructose-1,6-bisphosphatase/inositol monophosphatase family enzyme
VLDPIDGTKAFVRGIPTFGNLVAVLRQGRALVGVANFPALNELVYAGAGGGARWVTGSGQPTVARVSMQAKLDESVIEVASPWTFMRDGTWDRYEELARRGAKLRGWNDAYGFALVATGRVDAAVDLGIKVWDIAPFEVIVHEAGGWMTDWKGRETLDTDRVVMCGGALRDQLTGLLA